jgi:hypothetical protein
MLIFVAPFVTLIAPIIFADMRVIRAEAGVMAARRRREAAGAQTAMTRCLATVGMIMIAMRIRSTICGSSMLK